MEELIEMYNDAKGWYKLLFILALPLIIIAIWIATSDIDSDIDR